MEALREKYGFDVTQPDFDTLMFESLLREHLERGDIQPGIRNECAYLSGWRGALTVEYHKFFNSAVSIINHGLHQSTKSQTRTNLGTEERDQETLQSNLQKLSRK